MIEAILGIAAVLVCLLTAGLIAWREDRFRQRARAAAQAPYHAEQMARAQRTDGART